MSQQEKHRVTNNINHSSVPFQCASKLAIMHSMQHAQSKGLGTSTPKPNPSIINFNSYRMQQNVELYYLLI